jgi:hypothetical protein
MLLSDQSLLFFFLTVEKRWLQKLDWSISATSMVFIEVCRLTRGAMGTNKKGPPFVA